MRIEVILFKVGEKGKAADGSIIPRSTVESYLKSSSYKKLVNTKMALGGLSHKDRGRDNEFDSVPVEDTILLENNITHYIERVYLEGDLCKAIVVLFDDLDLYCGASKEYITTILRLLKYGVKMSLSIVVSAYWNDSKMGVEVCEEIVELKGMDWTCHPSFADAGVVKILKD